MVAKRQARRSCPECTMRICIYHLDASITGTEDRLCHQSRLVKNNPDGKPPLSSAFPIKCLLRLTPWPDHLWAGTFTTAASCPRLDLLISLPVPMYNRRRLINRQAKPERWATGSGRGLRFCLGCFVSFCPCFLGTEFCKHVAELTGAVLQAGEVNARIGQFGGDVLLQVRQAVRL